MRFHEGEEKGPSGAAPARREETSRYALVRMPSEATCMCCFVLGVDSVTIISPITSTVSRKQGLGALILIGWVTHF